jgi:hypothetical protein
LISLEDGDQLIDIALCDRDTTVAEGISSENAESIPEVIPEAVPEEDAKDSFNVTDEEESAEDPQGEEGDVV